MEQVYLNGSDDVARAARQMASAAEEMSRAAMAIQCALEQNQRFLTDWLTMLNQVIQDGK